MMRNKYLKLLSELVKQLEADKKSGELDMWENDLLNIMRVVLAAYWFFQVDGLFSHLIGWRLFLNLHFLSRTETAVDKYLQAEATDVAAGDIQPENMPV